MLKKNRKKRIRLYVKVVTCCLVLASVTVVLTTPETALTAPPEENPGGNVVKQDIPGELTLTGVSLTGDSSSTYSNLEAGTTCFIGRRRGIWVTLSKSSPRTMNLTLNTLDISPYNIPSGDGYISPGDDPWGVDTGVTPPGLPTEQPIPISQVELGIAPSLNVSGLGSGEVLLASTKLIFLDSAGDQWGLFFGPGRTTEDGWGGSRFLTSLDTPEVIIDCITQNKEWEVNSNTPGYLWYRGSRKNAPWVYVGKSDIAWSCNVNSLP